MMDNEYMVQLQDSKERTIMAINENAELLNKLDPCSEDYANLVDRQKELLVVLDRFIDEEQKINGLEYEEQKKLEEGKRQFKRDLIKIFASGGVSLLGIYLIEAFQAGGWIIKSPAMQFVPKPKV